MPLRAKSEGPVRGTCELSRALGRSDLGGNFSSEIVDLLLNALAHHIQSESFDLSGLGFEHLFDRLFVILNKRFVE